MVCAALAQRWGARRTETQTGDESRAAPRPARDPATLGRHEAASGNK
jgi:sodium/bile acid cotransporter 7